MAVKKNVLHEVWSLTIGGKHGRPYSFGLAQFGKSRFGEWDPLSGIYQRKHTKKGMIYRRLKHHPKVATYYPSQEPCRTKFAQGMASWKALTPEQKLYYNKLKYPRAMHGVNRFMRLYMKDKI